MGSKKMLEVEVADSRDRSTESDLEVATGLPDGVTWEALDERAGRVAKALMGNKKASGEGGQERA